MVHLVCLVILVLTSNPSSFLITAGASTNATANSIRRTSPIEEIKGHTLSSTKGFSKSARRSHITQVYTANLLSTPSVVVIGQTSTRAIVTSRMTQTSAAPNLQIISSLTESTTSKQFSTQISIRESRTLALSEKVTTTVFTRSSFLGFSEGLEKFVFFGALVLAGTCLFLFIIVVFYFKRKVKLLRRKFDKSNGVICAKGTGGERNKGARSSVQLKSFAFCESESPYENPLAREEEPEVPYVTITDKLGDEEPPYSNPKAAPDSTEADKSQDGFAPASGESDEAQYRIAIKASATEDTETHYSNAAGLTEPVLDDAESISSSPVYCNTSVLSNGDSDTYQQLKMEERSKEINESHYMSLLR